MKLKRCPNLHYYDEDRYPTCPHCAGAADKAPAPAPAPVPAPAPAPAPMPGLAPAPVQGEPWRCVCGAINNGNFCIKCGTKRPAPAPEKKSWTCVCGSVNEGNFCCRCGTKRPAEEPAAPAPEPVPEPVPEPEIIPEPEAAPENQPSGVILPDSEPAPEPELSQDPEPGEPSVAEQVEEVNFTGTIEEAKAVTAPPADEDEGVTQIIFDELADDLVLGWLVAANTSSRGKTFVLTDPKSTIGRGDAEHPVAIDLHGDRTVSRGAQAVIIYDPLNKKFFLQSADGKTIVYLNRQMLLAPAELAPYDKIMLGETELVFVPLCTEKFSW